MIPGLDEKNYLTRMRVVQTPWFGVLIHRFDTPDPLPVLHDHPYNFVSFVLKGGYTERRLNPLDMTVTEHHRVGFMNVMRTHDAHAITRLWRVPTWTIMFVGRRVRKFGFLERSSSWDSGDDVWLWTEFDKFENKPEVAQF